MTLLHRLLSWGVDYHGSTRSTGLIRIGLVFLIWARFGYALLPMHELEVGNFAFRIFFFVSTLAMALGIFSRATCATSAACLGLIYFYYGHVSENAEWTAHHIYLLFIATLFLSFTAAGHSYSFDRWMALRRAEQKGSVPPEELGNLLGLRLIALQLVAIYFWGAVAKMTPAFLNGERLQHMLFEFYAGIDFQTVPGFELACAIAGTTVAFFEVTLAACLLIPNFRRYLIPAGIAFHLIIYLFFPVLTFSLTMILLYLALIPADAIHEWLDFMQGLSRKDSLLTPAKKRPLSQVQQVEMSNLTTIQGESEKSD